MTRSHPRAVAPSDLAAASDMAADWVGLLFRRANPQAALQAAQALARSVEHTLALAGVLARSGRAVDLAGLEDLIGRLTAAAIDLDDSDRVQMQPVLSGLLHSLASLERALHPPPNRR